MEKNYSVDAEVNSCIEKASRAFSSLSRVLWNQKRILRLLKAVILSVLMYGLESVVLLSHHVQRLQAFDNKCLRIILGISQWKERRNTSIRAQAQQERVDTTLMQRRLCFLGHLTQMVDHRVPKQLLLCTYARGSRPLGGPCLTWKHHSRRPSSPQNRGQLAPEGTRLRCIAARSEGCCTDHQQQRQDPREGYQG